MAVYHKNQAMRLTAGADLRTSEGCFVQVDGSTSTVTLTAASTTPDKVFGLLESVDAKGNPVDIVLPGFSGIPGVRLHSGSAAVVPGDRLVLAANGTVTKGSSGTLVAIALAPAAAGQLVEARLIEPVTF